MKRKLTAALTILCAVALLGSCSIRRTTSRTPRAAEALPAAATPVPESAAVPSPTPSPTPPPTIAPTPPPTAEPVPEEPAFLRHSGVREDGTFDGGALFIGDEHTYSLLRYLQYEELLGEARYMAIYNMSLRYFYDSDRMPLGEKFSNTSVSACSPEFVGLSYGEAVEQSGENVTAIYFMLGSNWSTTTDSAQYIQVVGDLLEKCPNATVYLQTIPYSPMVAWSSVNEAIGEAFDYFADTAPERVVLVDTCAALPRDQLLSDGLHYSTYAMPVWYEYLTESARAAAE